MNIGRIAIVVTTLALGACGGSSSDGGGVTPPPPPPPSSTGTYRRRVFPAIEPGDVRRDRRRCSERYRPRTRRLDRRPDRAARVAAAAARAGAADSPVLRPAASGQGRHLVSTRGQCAGPASPARRICAVGDLRRVPTGRAEQLPVHGQRLLRHVGQACPSATTANSSKRSPCIRLWAST